MPAAAKIAKKLSIDIFLFLILVSPVVIIALLSLNQTRENLTDIPLSRRETIAKLTATVVKERLDKTVDLANSLAMRGQIRDLVENKEWNLAIRNLEDIPKDFPTVEAVLLANPEGTLMANTPHLPGVVGNNFAFRDWYKGVSAEWKPYVSEVFKRAPEPRYNVVAISVPIKNDSQEVTGVLVVSVVLNTFFDWAKETNVGKEGIIYIVDKNGHIAAHPRYDPQGEIVNFSSVPVVKKVLEGKSGVEVNYNPVEGEERLSAYAPVVGYGFGVVVAQPTRVAFAARDTTLADLTKFYYFLFLASAVSAFVTLHLKDELVKVRSARIDKKTN